MAAVITQILEAVKAVIEAHFEGPPAEPVFIRRASEQNPEFWADVNIAKAPAWLVHANADRKTEMAFAGADGPMKFVRYSVSLTRVTNELPGDREADDTIETALSQAAALFLASRNDAGKPGLQNVPAVNTCEVDPKGPYSLPYAAQTICASRIVLTFETIEPA